MNMKSRDFPKLWRSLEAILKAAPSTDIVFNQYRDQNYQVDLPNAAAIRAGNLRNYLAGAIDASVLAVGEAAGPWECRFSGVPFTGERQLLDPGFPLRGKRSSRNIPTRPIRVAPPFISRSAEIFWSVMLPYRRCFLVWNAFPLQPHQPHDFLTVRNPKAREVAQFGEALRLIAEYLQPSRIVAVGRKAFAALTAVGGDPVYVRHPSQGGKSEFTTGMKNLFQENAIKC